jgi:predicted nucleotidyltransferase
MSVVGKFGLPQSVIHSMKGIFSKHGADVLLYGSRAMGNFKRGSDIDLVIMNLTFSTDQLLKIESELDDLLIPYKIDLCLFHHIENPELRAHIERVGVAFE